MTEDQHFERQRERDESDAEDYERRIEEKIYALMSSGQPCYPWYGAAIIEAFAQADPKDLHLAQQAAEANEWGEWAALTRDLVRDYWRGVAEHMAKGVV